jgi:type IV fimbrial biogenesis protein FimT
LPELIRFSKGFSLLELMVVIVIISLTLSVALPTYQNMIGRFAITGQANDLLAAVSFARSEAIKSGVVVSLYGSSGAVTNTLGGGYCVISGAGVPGNCAGAIQLFSVSDSNLTAEIYDLLNQVQTSLQFDDLGGLAGTGGETRTISICRSGFVGRQIQISLIGRGRITTTGMCP